MKSARIPNFFIVGEPKSGTTALSHFLSAHPDIFISRPKEPAYFCRDLQQESFLFNGNHDYFDIRDEKVYLSLFKNANQIAVGEATTNYLYSRQAAKNIFDFNNKSKIIAVFREPVSFLVSLHNQFVNGALEDQVRFQNAVNLESLRKKGEHLPKKTQCPSELFYSERIKYTEQLTRYINLFGKDSVLPIIFDDFSADNRKIYRQVCEFLGTNSEFMPSFIKIHERKVPRNEWLNNWARQSSMKFFVKKHMNKNLYDTLQKKIQTALLRKSSSTDINGAFKAELKTKFRPEVDAFSKLVGRDLLTLWDY